MKFDCDCCGVCCKNIRHSYFYSEELDRGDGVCKHLKNNLCEIYSARPIFCNIDGYWEKFLSKNISREEFHELNHAACRRLKNLHDENSDEVLIRYDKLMAFIATQKFDSVS